jgi:hypothetical protein
MSLKNLALSLVLVAATSLVAIMLAGYMCSAGIARAGHGSHFANPLADHRMMTEARIPHPAPRHVRLHDALTQSGSNAVAQ